MTTMNSPTNHDISTLEKVRLVHVGETAPWAIARDLRRESSLKRSMRVA
jgi:hypothetical protein